MHPTRVSINPEVAVFEPRPDYRVKSAMWDRCFTTVEKSGNNSQFVVDD